MAGVQAGDVGGGHHQIIDVNDLMLHLSDNIKEKLKSLDEALIENTAGNEEQTNIPTIPRVPIEMHGISWNFTKPRVVSIGPYHQDDPHGSTPRVTEEMKIKLAALFIKEHEVNKEGLYCMIKMAIKDFRNCYELDTMRGYNDDDLAWMFLIDGCVVLHSIYVMKYGLNIRSRKNEGSEIRLALAHRLEFEIDIMFLEKQLPYRLLQLIIDSSKESDRKKLEKSIQHFILSMMWNNQPVEVENQMPEENQKNALHLLDLFWKTVTCVRTNRKSSVMEWIIEALFKIIGTPVDTLMNFIILNFLDKIPRIRRSIIFPNLRSIQDLKEAGVELKLNNTGSLTDVKFSRGILHLPVIVVNYEIPFKLMNLMAYEISRPNKFHNYEVCSYVHFLASLIDRPEDVKELRAKGILYNHRNSDEEVVQLFKSIRLDKVGVDFVYKYHEILEEIWKHYNKRRYRAWIAQLKTRYFESPWSVIALFGATMALVLTFLQTYYSILSYYKG